VFCAAGVPVSFAADMTLANDSVGIRLGPAREENKKQIVKNITSDSFKIII